MKILIVDADSEIEQLFRSKFGTDNYTFFFVKDGGEAMNQIRSKPELNVVLLDLHMPGLGGFSLLSELPQLNPALRAVGMSSQTDLSSIRKAMNLGAFDFLPKPLNFEDLKATLIRTANALEESREKRHINSLDELKSRFFDNITHEFRTPLTLILGPVEKLLRDEKQEEARQKLRLVQRNARQLLRITNQLLDLARLESGNLTVHEAAGDLGQFIEKLVEAFQPLAEDRKLHIRFENQLTQNYFFDAEKIEQIVHNLLANALKFTLVEDSSGPKEIVILLLPRHQLPPLLLTDYPQAEHAIHSYSPHTGTLEPQPSDSDSEGVRLLVKDPGIGIQPKRLPHIFDRFHTLNPKDLRPNVALVQPSTGIGLAFIKELTELMEGTISVSSAINQGTVFSLELPLKPASEQEHGPDSIPTLPVLDWHEPTEPRPEKRSSEKAAVVLVVEDDAELRTFIADELRPIYEVLTAADGKIAWEIAQTELPDVVISDVAMPNMDGFRLTNLLKKHPATDHIAVLLLTSKTNEKDILKGLEEGADIYLPKPFHLEELHLRLRNLLTRQQKLQLFYQQQLIGKEASEPVETVQDKFLRKVYELIEERLDDSAFSVESLAEMLAISRKTLYRKIQGLTQLSPNELIRQYRLKKATNLLKIGYSASETAYMVGFETPSYFGQCFKELYGLTPMEYVGKTSA
ncbi:response regulator [Arundinibacter roseus]|uniref:histidine kinase n=1 Tax=Arundinibacter roseus TaxID=2070510 RepID=A0A4R4KPW3_9BACT|nr:response regulator [Arundinibacter roseus]TDB68932.1 response regulator [Arundinibacter roseus]